MQRERTLTNTSALADVIKEFVETERSYVRRLQVLKNDYADPLRMFSKKKETAIIAAYEANTLFGNIDNILPVNEAFLSDLDQMSTTNAGSQIGDVALKHFKDLKGFEQYKLHYAKYEEAQEIYVREYARRSSAGEGFAGYIDVRMTRLVPFLPDGDTSFSYFSRSGLNILLPTPETASV